MAQPLVSSYFITRKRGIDEEIAASKKKVICLEQASCELNDADDYSNKIVYPSSSKLPNNVEEQKEAKTSKKTIAGIASVRQGITPQRTRSSRRVQMQNVDGIEIPKPVNFFLGGSLSPQKKSKKQLESKEPPKEIIEKKDDELIERNNHGMQTPTKKPILTKEGIVEKTSLISTNTLNTDEIKKKLRASSKLTELKTSLNKLRNGFDRLDQMEQKRKEMEKAAKQKAEASLSLKPFKKIELEILSPKKTFTSPIKLKDSPMKNTLIGSPKFLTPKKLLFSPTKSSPVKAPAYERFQSLAEVGTPTLQLPFKYRYILEVFKAVDTVCAMFFNRKEKITFKKLKPAVQRIMRKNFYETHLAQIHKLMPNAYKFAQEKTRNYGSTSKQDYYQLVITPNINCDDEDVSQLILSPQILIQRYRKMTEILTDLVYVQHDKFLQSLDIPMNVTRGALKRWHPDFQLESVPDIENGDLPMPPNVERFSSAKDVLSTARNLFNCSTPMERALERLEAKKIDEKSKQLQNKEQIEANVAATTPTRSVVEEKKKQPVPETSSALLKGVPQSLLEKIRAKQAAKALDAMTRRPSQERDAAKYSRLPEVARHIRNVFVTEKKGVLPLENVLIKIENSYKANASLKELEELLRILAKEQPRFISFHEIRNMMFVKLNRDSDLTQVVQKLQELASQKAQIQ